MSVSAIRITYFQADKLRCAGAALQSAPYRITTYRGPEVGLLGLLPAVLNKVHEMNTAEAANSAQFESSTPSLFERLTRRYRHG
jgi:hypothetical protein